MEQGNYKSLILKLSGAALGLVVMLGGAATLGQNFIADKSFQTMNSDSHLSSSTVVHPSNSISQEELELKLSMNEEFQIIVESGAFIADEALKQARLALEKVKSEGFNRQLEVNSDTIEAISEAIVEITSEMSIPSALKDEILDGLEVQLKNAEKELNALEDHVLTFSYKTVLPHSEYAKSSTCNQQKVIVEKCDSGECVESGEESNAKDERKGAVAAFYWI